MSFDKSTFTSIYNELVFDKSNETANDKIIDNSLQLGVLLGQSSLALNHSNESTLHIHGENVQIYQKAVKELKHYSTVLKGGNTTNVVLTLNPDEFNEYLKFPCRGKFLDCNSDKISASDIDILLKTSLEPQNVQNNKRSFADDTTSSHDNSANKFFFRETKVNSIVRSPAPPVVQLDVAIDNENSSRPLNFGFKLNQSDPVRREIESNVEQSNTSRYADVNGQRDKLFLHQNLPPQNRNNLVKPPNRQPLFSYGNTKKVVDTNTTRDVPVNSFITAREELHRQSLLKNGQNPNQASNSSQFSYNARDEFNRQNSLKNGESSNQTSNTSQYAYGTSTKTLGIPRRSVHSKFIPPIPNNNEMKIEADTKETCTEEVDERLKNIDPKMVELIRSEIMDQGSLVDWDDIAGLEYAKTTIQEAVIWPLLRPDIFTGLRGPPRGILLFGPPGTGKTLIGRCIAAKSQSTFFSISASSLTSKWIGDGEKMVRALFAVANVHQPSVIFIDEIDSLLSQRSDTEHESSRRLKTEFLVQLDGARTSGEEKILIVGATNRPQELDEAARRRLIKRLYIPLPELDARIQILTLLLKKEPNQISEDEIIEIGRLTEGFSGADMKTLCHEALMGPIRSIRLEDMRTINVKDVRLVNFMDFTNALKRVRASVSQDDLVQYEKWDSTYGLGAAK